MWTTLHRSWSTTFKWQLRKKQKLIIGRNDLFVVLMLTTFKKKKKSSTFSLNSLTSFFTFYLKKMLFSHCSCSCETFKVASLKLEGDTTGHVDHMATSICTLAEHLNESTTWQWQCFDPTHLTHSRYISTRHYDLSCMGDKHSGSKSEF